MAVGVEVQEIPKGLDGDDCARRGILAANGWQKDGLKRFPCAAAQFGEEFPIIEEVAPENLWHAEGEVPVGGRFEDPLTKPLPEFHYSLLVAGRAEVAALAGECQEVFMAAVLAFHAGKAVVEDAAIQIAEDHLLHISTEEPVLGGKALVIDLLKFLKGILNASVVLGVLRFARAVCGRSVGHRLCCP
jgi:hypothetical protein